MHKFILVPLDLEEPDLIKAALDAARAQALASNASVRLMYAIPLVPSLYLEFVPAGFEKDEKERAAKKLAQYAAELGLPEDRVSYAVAQGGIFHVVMAQAKKWKADLIIVNSRWSSLATFLIERHGTSIVRYAECSVLVLR